jgi:membrane glycosyltransferase
MVHQVKAVLCTLAGFDGGWMPHAAGRPSLRVLLRVHVAETCLGLGLVTLATLGHLTVWLLPVAVSLILTVPLSWLAQRDVGRTWVLRPLPEAVR